METLELELEQDQEQGQQQDQRAVPPLSNWRWEVAPYDLFLAVILGGLVAVDVGLARRVRLIGPEHLLDGWPWFRFGLMYFVLLYCCRRPLTRLVNAARMAMWSGILINPINILVQLAGRSHYRLVDLQLAAIDQRMHFSTAAISNVVRHVPLLFAGFLVAYSLFGPLVLSAMMVPSVCGHDVASRRFLLAILFTLVLAAAIFAFVPAAGPWTSEALRPMATQTGVTNYLLRLKSGLPVRMDMDHAGIVSFPSVHVAFALLSARTLEVVKRIRILAWVISGLVCISTITTGWHYGIDVIGGVAVALLADAVAKRMCAILERLDVTTITALTREVCTR